VRDAPEMLCNARHAYWGAVSLADLRRRHVPTLQRNEPFVKMSPICDIAITAPFDLCSIPQRLGY
jgi:hypothetical protein